MIKDRMPPLAAERMTPAQKKAAAELAAGPRGGVRGPFIPLLRSPDLMDRLQKVGEYLRLSRGIARTAWRRRRMTRQSARWPCFPSSP